METYYQESGRAGRDGLPSECVLFFRPGDAPRQSSMVFYENCGLQNLYDMVRYCQSKRNCRRSAFFQHFGERVQDCNGMCDNCTYGNDLKEVDATGHAKAIISVLHEMQENDQRATILQTVDKIRSKIKGLDTNLKKDELEHLIVQLIIDRVLKEEFQHTPYATNAYVTLGPLWKQVLHGQRKVKLEFSTGQGSKNANLKTGKRSSASALEIKLDELRKELSSSQGGIFPHAVLSAQQIRMLSTQKPTSMDELEKMIGKLKTEKYGSKIINDIQQYVHSEVSNDGVAIEVGGDEKNSKKRKISKAVVLVESSEDEG